MIDTSVVRVHQHGACIADNNHQHIGRSRGGLTSKIHAVVDTNGLPVHLTLTPAEAHDNRLCSVLLGALLPQTMLLADRGYDTDWIRELARRKARGPIFHRSAIAKILSASARSQNSACPQLLRENRPCRNCSVACGLVVDLADQVVRGLNFKPLQSMLPELSSVARKHYQPA